MVMISRAEVLMVWRLFRADAAHNLKRIALTVLAIAWGTLSIVLLLSFGEGMKRSFHRNSRGMGEGIGVVWAGATTKPYIQGLRINGQDYASPWIPWQVLANGGDVEFLLGNSPNKNWGTQLDAAPPSYDDQAPAPER